MSKRWKVVMVLEDSGVEQPGGAMMYISYEVLKASLKHIIIEELSLQLTYLDVLDAELGIRLVQQIREAETTASATASTANPCQIYVPPGIEGMPALCKECNRPYDAHLKHEGGQ